MKEKLHNLELSAVLTVLGIVMLFSCAVLVTLIAPSYIDPAWTTPSSAYQAQMYERSDPHFYISSGIGDQLQYVHHLKEGVSYLAFKESESFKIHAPEPLEHYVTRAGDKDLKITDQLLLLKKVAEGYELYAPDAKEAFAIAMTDGIIQDWTEDGGDGKGVIYISNPVEFRVLPYIENGRKKWMADASGYPIQSLEELKSPPYSFTSRKDLIEQGEHIFAIEGCWYCHTDQTRTLIQDVVLNGSDSYPAPPSSPNEYIYQKISFPGTKRNGPDISRVGIKRPSRDWHKAHFWSPKTASAGSIMPSFRHFFDFDPRGTSPQKPGVPNKKFEAVYQYLMTKGTRITAPNEAWWLGKDPIQTKEIIEGKKRL